MNLARIRSIIPPSVTDKYSPGKRDFNQLLSNFLKRAAKMAPDILCHTEKMAPGTVAIAKFGNDVIASEVANPEFCMPISIDIAFFLARFMCRSVATPNPAIYPNKLCNITTAKITKPVSKIRVALCETTEAIMSAIATIDINGK